MSGLHLLGSLAIIMLELKSSLSQAWCCVGLQLLAAGAAIGAATPDTIACAAPAAGAAERGRSGAGRKRAILGTIFLTPERQKECLYQ